MQKKSAKRKRNVKNLALITTLTAVVLVVSTFAWFIALDEVQFTDFNVTIAPTQGLEFSINGTEWFGGADAVGSATAGNLTIDESNYDTGAYENNTNSWTGIATPAVIDTDGTTILTPASHWGLIPMSSSGQVNPASSRLILYDKTSLTSTDLDTNGDLTSKEWGYRLMSDPVPNTGAEEHKGYIAFDLLVKNTTDEAYYDNVNIQNEEAIYLTIDSAVTAGVADYGLENSVRVGFAQIARMEIPETGNVSAAEIQGLTCSATDAICRPAAIWEPNDTKHSANAIDFYGENCTTAADPAVKCSVATPLVNGTAVPTYAVAQKIVSTDAVDIYDGVFNGNMTSSDTTGGLPLINNMSTTSLIGSYDTYVAADAADAAEQMGYYFTDTEKNTGITYDVDGTTITAAQQNDRPAFMYLAPNSITKVRVYVWLEGQDIDNYDWASLGESVNVNFGFTKQQLSDDIEFNS